MSEKRASRSGVIAAFIAIYLIWGSTYLAIRFAVETIPPLLMAGVRFLTAGGILYGIVSLRGIASPPTRSHWRSAAIIGGLLLLGANGAVSWAEQHVPSSFAALFIATVPLWMVAIDWLRPGGVRPGGQVIAGLALGLAGIVVLIGPGELADGSRLDPVGAGLLIFAAISWAAGSVYTRHADLPGAPLLATAMEMLAGGGMLVILGLLTGGWTRLELANVTFRSLLSLGYLVVFGSLVAFSAYVWLLQVSTPAHVSTYAYVNPVVAVLLGWALAGEPFGMRTLVAGGIIVASVVLITTYRARQAAHAESTQASPAIPAENPVVPE